MGLFDSIKNIFSQKEGEDRASLSKRVQASPQDPQARQKLGVFLLRQGEVVEGLDQLARAAIMYEKDGFAGKAVAILRHMLKHDPSNVEFLRWLIRLLAEEGLTGDAIREFENVIRRQGIFASDDQQAEFIRHVCENLPQNPLPFLFLADLHRGNRKFYETITALDKAARSVEAAGMVSEFSERLSGLIEAAGDNLEILEACGFLWLRVGKVLEAEILLSEVIEKTREEGEPGNAEEMEQVLEAVRINRNAGGALSFSDAARKLAEPLPQPAVVEAAEAAPEAAVAPKAGDDYRDDENIVKDALSRLQAKVTEEIGETDPEARYDLGIAYKEMGLLDEAIGEFMLVRRKPELFLGASSLLADTLAAKGEFDQGLKTLDEVLSTDSLTEEERRDVRYHKAALLARGGKEVEANGIFLELFGEAPGYRDVAAKTKSIRD